MALELSEFVPVKRETIRTIRARLDADVNAGIPPTDLRWIDTTPGGWWWDLSQVVGLEMERIWDFFSVELPASMFPAYAFQDYLNEWGTTLNLPRKPAARATGVITFEGEPGTEVPTGTQVAVVQLDPLAPAVTYQTLRDGLLAVVPGPVGLGATFVSSGGTLHGDIYYYAVAAVTPDGETVPSAEVQVNVSATNTNQVTLAWTAYDDAIGYQVYRGTASGILYRLVTLGVATGYVDDGAATLQSILAPTNDLPVEATTPDINGNVPPGTVTELLSPVVGVTAVYNLTAMTGGNDVETDDEYQRRILLELGAPQGGGTVGDYMRWSLSHPSIGYATVTPIWDGPGTVKVVVTDEQNNPVSATVLDELQLFLDPVPERGMGQAPIGAIVTVGTPTTKLIAVVATLSLLAGYSLDGLDGSIPVRVDVDDAIRAYIDSVPPGDDIVFERVSSTVFQVEGIYDLTALTLNGTSANVIVAPDEVASTSTITLNVI